LFLHTAQRVAALGAPGGSAGLRIANFNSTKMLTAHVKDRFSRSSTIVVNANQRLVVIEESHCGRFPHSPASGLPPSSSAP
jgi:hypothetical protein